MIIQLPSDNSEGIVLSVVVNVDLGQSGAGPWGDPSLQAIIVHHHGRPGAAYWLLAVGRKDSG